MVTSWRDDRRFHLVTRGNVDGIVSAAFFYARIPDIRVSFVTSSSGAVDALRRDIQSREFYIVDLGVTDDLVQAIHLKAKSGALVHLLDHHQQSEAHPAAATGDFDALAVQGVSAARLAYRFLGLDGEHEHLAAVADLVEYCEGDELRLASERFGPGRLAEEARMLDFAWRLEVDDDRFRQLAARRLAEGRWPSEVPEIQRRYLQVLNEGRWERALDKVRARLKVRNGLGVLRFGRYRTSLHGFGTRALSHVAEEQGCQIALLVNSRRTLTSLSLRGLGPTYRPGGDPPLNLGRFVEDFTKEFGLTGGGHPSSAGAKIYTRDVPVFLDHIRALA
jgi:single-stranded-DNA-specific exonuclease